MNLRHSIYNVMVNKKPGISYRYHKMHDGSNGAVKVISWFYLLWLNFAYYVLFCHFLGKRPDVEYYESKRIPTGNSESQEYRKENPNLSVSAYVNKLSQYDIISFDVFDTLIFRPLSQPTDVFYMIGEQMDILDFKNIRAWAEWDARVKCHEKHGHMEVSFEEIWKNLEEDTGLSAAKGMEIEQQIEGKLCYANPFMLEVWNRLIEMEKKIIVVSDMYLPKECIVNILERAGFVGAHKIYISNEYRKSKAGGRLYRKVIMDLYSVDTDTGMKSGKDISRRKGIPNTNPNGFSIVHIGDNQHSDNHMARGYGIDVYPYPNVNHNALLYRPFDMSYLIGSAYRGLVSNHLYNGLYEYSMEYEYGYLYGGLFVVGYCSFIHDYCKKNQVEKLLFLSRDGDILKQVYDALYPGENTEYVYWSRKAATKLMANEDKHDYFRRFIYHKVNQKYTIRDILHSMELDFLVDELCDWKEIWLERTVKSEQDSRALALKQLAEDKMADQNKLRKRIVQDFSEEVLEKKRKKNFVDLRPDDELTDRNGYLLRRFIEAKWDKVLAAYDTQQKAAGKYYQEILHDCRKAAAVDIGWAGSGALALSYLVNKVWGIPCEIIGMIAGTNTVHNAEPDASEPFLQSGRLVAYLYSQSHNRDLLKKHDPNKDYNVYWELLLSSPTPQFAGFYNGKLTGKTGDQRADCKNSAYLQDLDITLRFGKYDTNQDGIREIQRGILDFAHEYQEHFKDFPYMFNISGRDAYAPMLVAASHNEKYLKAIAKRFALEINVN